MPASSVAAIATLPPRSLRRISRPASHSRPIAPTCMIVSGGPVDFVLSMRAAQGLREKPRAGRAQHSASGDDGGPHSAWPDDTLFVVYCAGPHCNGADRAALKLAGRGRPVKIDARRHDRMGGRELSLRHRLRTGFAEGRIRCVNRRWFLALKRRETIAAFVRSGRHRSDLSSLLSQIKSAVDN